MSLISEYSWSCLSSGPIVCCVSIKNVESIYRYFFCEFLCFLNVFGQFFLMNWFFDGEFLEYGLKVIRYAKHDQSLTYDPMTFIFPRMTKCE